MISEKHGISEAQVALAWLLQKDGVGAIAGTSGEHLRTNLAAKSIRLDKNDIQRIENINKNHRCIDYDFSPWN
jgi:2,5-diketo-D-gluconate reductase B